MWDFIKGLELTRLCHKTMGGVQGTPNGYLEAESSAKNCLKGVRHIEQAGFFREGTAAGLLKCSSPPGPCSPSPSITCTVAAACACSSQVRLVRQVRSNALNDKKYET